jgi:hypothetical protein
MLSGVYQVCFRKLSEAGKGIIQSKEGRIAGGDSWYVYGCTIDIAGDWVSATIQVINDEPSSSGTFGRLTDFVTTVSGRASRRDLSLKPLQKGNSSLFKGLN